ncbi:simple sugar transport system ATP-binding protein [Paenibacillus sp. DS2015]|uniref:ABC transporter ATP-binding protein n=1 Tax=Paenibacillus sp. DS2015 TaxID=3373917 RepID=UPI003D24BA23
MTEWSVEMKQITKKFGTVVANDAVDFLVGVGEIHALLGENGAGKSTMMSMLSGMYRADQGSIRIHGQVVEISSPKMAMDLGIGTVHQNFRLVPTLTAMENIVLGEKSSVWRGRSWHKRKKEEVGELAQHYGLGFPVDTPIWQLSVGEQQRVEIVKTLYRGADIIILDEPTSVLTPGEVEQLFLTMERLKQSGKSMIITTHKLKEVMAVSDHISVMRKGKMIASMPKQRTHEHHLAMLMVGREMKVPEQRESQSCGEIILSVHHLNAKGDDGRQALKDVSLDVFRGEIVGIAGVAGNGQKELAEVLTGTRAKSGGTVEYDGRQIQKSSVRHLIEGGIAHIPENRMKSGLAGSLGAVDNLLLKSYRQRERSIFGFLRKKHNEQWSRDMIEQFDVVTPALHTPVRQLSGGNQQKLLFAREVEQNPQLMIAVHPTQGLDIAASESVCDLLLNLRNRGSGILLISEDLDELLEMCDRIVVLYDGTVNGEVTREEANKETLGLYMAGMTKEREEAV